MGNMLGSILAGASSMRTFEKALNVVQSNVTNANTPGYVKQTLDFTANAGLDLGRPGGVTVGQLLNARDEHAERSVRRQQSSAGEAGQRAADLAQIEPIFDLSSTSGVSATLNKFFNSFSQLSVAPNDNLSRRAVIDRATDVANSINQGASALVNATGESDTEIRQTVSGINQLLSKIANLNVQYRERFEAGNDPSLDADVNQTLEQLSQLVNFTSVKADDGSTTITIGGQAPAVIGEHFYALHADFGGAQARILDVEGKDLSGQVGGGQIGALLKVRNETIPSYLSELNTLAGGLADSVNAALAGGLDANGNVPTTALFSYDAATGAALTLTVNAIAPSEIAAASVTAQGGNGNALLLADLGKSKQINGFTFTEFYGNLSGRVGGDLATAIDDQQSTKSLLTQARNIRNESSGVSLDEEAAKLIQFQKSYEASAKLISVLNDMMDVLIGIVR
jgi:flagellar hook-associated protein 1 FlgK